MASVADELEKLMSLKQQGALTDKEFEQQKASLLKGKKKWPLWIKLPVLAIALLFLISGLGKLLPPPFVSPSDSFLKSEMMLRAGILETRVTVEKFVGLIKIFQMDNGESPVIQGWTQEDNIYTLHVAFGKDPPLLINFAQDLTDDSKGRYSLLLPIDSPKGQMPASAFYQSILSGPFINQQKQE